MRAEVFVGAPTSQSAYVSGCASVAKSPASDTAKVRSVMAMRAGYAPNLIEETVLDVGRSAPPAVRLLPSSASIYSGSRSEA